MHNRYRVISVCGDTCDVQLTKWPNAKISWRFEYTDGLVRITAINRMDIQPIELPVSKFSVGTIIETEYCLHPEKVLY